MPAVSKKQQKFMGIVRAIQKGEEPAGKFSKDAQKAAKKMKKSSVKKYAKTKHDDLPTKKESYDYKKAHKKFKDTGELPPHLKKLVKDLDKVKVKHKVKNIVVPGLEWMSKLGEAADRDYKAEYKKFQSSTKAKKYRAELNKYNRQKGTYGNGDGKDASHKGGKIVGFESQSKNRGRAEKSRLKKEINDYVDGVLDEMEGENMVNEESKVLKSIQNLAKKNKYGTVSGTRMNAKTANMIMKIYNHPKMKKYKKAMDNYTSDELADMTIKMPKLLGIKEGVNENSTEKKKILKLMIKYGDKPKDAKKELEKHYKKAKGDRSKATPAQLAQYIGYLSANESVNEKKLVGRPMVKKAIQIAKKMKGNMTGAVKKIEKMMPGLSKQIEVEDALRKANESINEKLNQSQAKVLLKQLGGNKFIMMTGAKNFGLGPKGMGFKIGRNSKKINYIRIDLDRGKDLYNMEFIRMARKKGELSPTLKVVKKIKGVYADQLQKMFTKYTGMYTSL